MFMPGADTIPALWGAGDIGVSAEWRDLNYDWTPLLTPIGVSMYEQCRDTYDHQRALYPFLLSPQGPTKQAMQRKLGLRTGYTLQGPEYLLATVGLLHVEVGSYGPSADPERPNHTRLAFYVVGRLDHPTLDWPMLDRLLEAVRPALEPPPADEGAAALHKKAEAALRSLGQAGFLQHCDPEDLFYPLGAWPNLLPQLVADPRWIALFTQLHGVAAMHEYRTQARAWVEYAQRLAQRLRQQNDDIRDQVVAAQRRGPRGGGSSTPPRTLTPTGTRESGQGRSSMAVGAAQEPVAQQRHQGRNASATAYQIAATPAHALSQEPVSLNQTAFVAAESLSSRYPAAVTQAGPATLVEPSAQQAPMPDHATVAAESLSHDQLMSRCYREEKKVPLVSATAPADDQRNTPDAELPAVAPHLRDAELSSTRYDAAFWCGVNMILYGKSERYQHTAGEKKAAERRFKQQNMPIGVVLAALRALMTLPHEQHSTTFGGAISTPTFQACLQQALALIPARAQSQQPGWPEFLQAYRSVGAAHGLRNVSVTDYHVLFGLFQSEPDECWAVLNRVERATTAPNLSPAYLRRAINNNQQAATRRIVDHAAPPPACSAAPSSPSGKESRSPMPTVPTAPPDDPREVLLEQAGLSRKLLQQWMTVEYIQAWLAEAAARPNLDNAQGWLIWGLNERCLPQDHPRLPPRPTAKPGKPAKAVGQPVATGSSTPPNPPAHEHTWQAVLRQLQAQLPAAEFETWIKEAVLLELDAEQAIIGVPNVFVREWLAENYRQAICQSLRAVTRVPLEVQIVIGTA